MSSLLGWYKKTKKAYGRKSAATIYLKKLIDVSEKGHKQEIIVDDFQAALTLESLHQRGLEEKDFSFIDKLVAEETQKFEEI